MDKLEPTLANLELSAPVVPAALPDVRPELNRVLLRKLPLESAGQLALIALAAVLLFRHTGATAFWTWLILVVGVQAVRQLLAFVAQREGGGEPSLLLLALTALAAGLGWGALALKPLQATDVATQSVLMWAVAAALIWFAATQAARFAPFALFAAGALLPWLLKLPGFIGAESSLSWLQPEVRNLAGLGLFLAFGALAAVVYAFQRQAETVRLRAEAEVGPLNEDRASLAVRVDQLQSALQERIDSINAIVPAENIKPAPSKPFAAEPTAAAAPSSAPEASGSARIEPRAHTSQALRVITSIDNMLVLNKLARGAIKAERQRVSLRSLLQDLLQPAARSAQDKRLKLRSVLHAGVPLEVITDAQRLHHILANLITNAIHFTARGEVTLNVRNAQASNRLSFEISDTGLGIAKEDQQKVFEPYYQASKRESDNFSGLGLGLTVARELARLLGGEITLDSQPGQGTLCVLTLPVEVPAGKTASVGTAEELAFGAQANAERSTPVGRVPATNDAFSARGDGFRNRQEPVYATQRR